MTPQDRAEIIVDAKRLKSLARRDHLRAAGLPRWLQPFARWFYNKAQAIADWGDRQARS